MNYDPSTNYRWSPQTTGKYVVSAYLRLQASTDEVWVQLIKNGSTYLTMADTRAKCRHGLLVVLAILNHTSASSDYYEVWVYQGSGGNLTSGSAIENC